LCDGLARIGMMRGGARQQSPAATTRLDGDAQLVGQPCGPRAWHVG